MTLFEALNKLNDLNYVVNSFLNASKYKENSDLSGLDFDSTSAEELFLIDELRFVSEKLEDASCRLNYLKLPIVETSRITMNSRGYYETKDGFEYHCGYSIEFFIADDRHEHPYWTCSSVESGNNGYYIVGHRDVPMEGLMVRRRRV